MKRKFVVSVQRNYFQAKSEMKFLYTILIITTCERHLKFQLRITSAFFLVYRNLIFINLIHALTIIF